MPGLFELNIQIITIILIFWMLNSKNTGEFGLEPPKGRENELTSVNLDKYKDMWRKVYE